MKVKNPFRQLGNLIGPQSAIDEGWSFKHPKPKLSPEKKKELMEATSLETPRSSMRAVWGVLSPYITKSSMKERAIAASLLATSLFMTWYAVQITVDFGNWQSGLTNTLQQLFQAMITSKPDIITDAITNYGALNDLMSNSDMLNTVLMKYPDATSLLFDPAMQEILQQNPDLITILQENPTIEEVFMAIPEFKQQAAANPELVGQLSSLSKDVSGKLFELPTVKQQLSNLATLCGADFLNTWGGALASSFNSVAHGMTNPELNEQAKDALGNAWGSRDLATIALKFTAMAIISYKASQYLALRWRAWTTGYYMNKWTEAKAYEKLKNKFNNIDNPGQRIQEDPASFTAGAVSLMTGATNSIIQLASFSGMLWGMGSVMGVEGGMFWIGLAYASALTGLTVAVGRKYPEIRRNQQRREADFRASLDQIHNNAELIAQNGTEEVEKQQAQKKFRPVMRNSVRDIGTQVKLIIVDATAGNLSIPIPYVAGAFAVAAGTASMGTIQTINYAFNRVTSAMSFFVNRFDQLSGMKATADRIHMFDQAIDAARYIEEEKAQASQQIAEGKQPTNPSDNTFLGGPS